MSKFKVIENSRFLNNNELGCVKGGISILTCPNTQAHVSQGCTSTSSHISCTPAASASGYSMNNCQLIGSLHTCGDDMNFSINGCFGWSAFTSTCPGGRVYFFRP